MSKEPEQGTVPATADDDVYPVHEYDAASARRVFVTRVMRFNDVLDAEMLRASLSKLLEIGDWRKLGGCLQYRVRDCQSTTTSGGYRAPNANDHDAGRQNTRDTCPQKIHD